MPLLCAYIDTHIAPHQTLEAIDCGGVERIGGAAAFPLFVFPLASLASFLRHGLVQKCGGEKLGAALLAEEGSRLGSLPAIAGEPAATSTAITQHSHYNWSPTHDECSCQASFLWLRLGIQTGSC